MVAQGLGINNGNKAKTGGYKFKPLSPKKINVITLIFLSVFILGGLGLFIYPATVRVQDLRSRLNRTEAELQEKQRIADALEELIRKFQDDLKLAEPIVFTDRDVATFLNNFSDFAKQANMTLISIKRLKSKPVPSSTESEEALKKKDKKKGRAKDKPEDEAPGLLMWPMEIEVKGEYPDLINFLISLEEYKQLLTINDLNVRLSREGYPNLEAKFIIRLYTMEAPKARIDEGV